MCIGQRYFFGVDGNGHGCVGCEMCCGPNVDDVYESNIAGMEVTVKLVWCRNVRLGPSSASVMMTLSAKKVAALLEVCFYLLRRMWTHFLRDESAILVRECVSSVV